MFRRIEKVLIGKDINRSADVTETPWGSIAGAAVLADGEILVLDKNYVPIVPGATLADTDTIYICEGLAENYAYSNRAGLAVTDARRVLISDPIEGRLVKSWRGVSYDAKSEQATSVDWTGWVPVVGTEYIVRIVYNDINEHPGQFTQTYRYVSTTAVLGTAQIAIMNLINADPNRRVQATMPGADVLTLTGLPIPECTTGLTDIDKFSMVRFNAFFNYVDANGSWQTLPSTVTTVTDVVADYGAGTWEQLRDLEKYATAGLGNSNKTHFPVKSLVTRTVAAETYDILVIEHDKSYLSPDNQYVKAQPLTTIVALPDGAGQTANLLAALNPWMASCPGAFTNVAV